MEFELVRPGRSEEEPCEGGEVKAGVQGAHSSVWRGGEGRGAVGMFWCVAAAVWRGEDGLSGQIHVGLRQAKSAQGWLVMDLPGSAGAGIASTSIGVAGSQTSSSSPSSPGPHIINVFSLGKGSMGIGNVRDLRPLR